MSRDMMRGLKAKVEEEARLQKVEQIVSQIYQSAVQLAKTKTDTSYNYQLPSARASQYRVMGLLPTNFPHDYYNNIITDPFYMPNMPQILAGLQELFPGCYIKHTLLSKGTDGKMYDISKLDEKVLPFVNRALDQSYIVIDWS